MTEKSMTTDIAALDPALSERAGEVLEGVTPGPWWTEPEGTIRNDSEGNPRWDLPRIVRYNATGQSVCKAHLIGGKEPDPALANARFIAWCREGVPALLAQNAFLLAEINALRAEAQEMGAGMVTLSHEHSMERARANAAEAREKRLRDGCNLQQRDGERAADRIEQLVKDLAEADALIKAQAKDHASNNIRLAETAHRAERLEAALQKLACNCPSNCDWEHDDICPSWIARAALSATTEEGK